MNICELSKRRKPIIGALHFSPLLGYDGFLGYDKILENALKDMDALAQGGADAVIIENNYDIPHTVNVGPNTISSMTYLGAELKRNSTLPMGVSVLWNDFRASLSIAKTIGACFIRVPVFVDAVRTDFGEIYATPADVIEYRRKLHGEDIAILADIQVKHAQMLKKIPISESARMAEHAHADAVIVTGSWTGIPPTIEDLDEVNHNTNVPVLIGSGLDKDNANKLLKHADGAIVSTSIKEGISDALSERNVKPYTARISKTKVKLLMDELIV